jgi:hypothetical protein
LCNLTRGEAKACRDLELAAALNNEPVVDRAVRRVAALALGRPHDEMAPLVVGASKSSHVAWRLKQRRSGDVDPRVEVAGFGLVLVAELVAATAAGPSCWRLARLSGVAARQVPGIGRVSSQ